MPIAARPGKPFAQLRFRAAGRDDHRARSRQSHGLYWSSPQAFFNTVRTHTMEGMFADPVYGGKRTSPAGC
jgi:hypothetical protein